MGIQDAIPRIVALEQTRGPAPIPPAPPVNPVSNLRYWSQNLEPHFYGAQFDLAADADPAGVQVEASVGGRSTRVALRPPRNQRILVRNPGSSRTQLERYSVSVRVTGFPWMARVIEVP